MKQKRLHVWPRFLKSRFVTSLGLHKFSFYILMIFFISQILLIITIIELIALRVKMCLIWVPGLIKIMWRTQKVTRKKRHYLFLERLRLIASMDYLWRLLVLLSCE